MGDAAVDRISRDVVLARHVEPPVRVWNDPLMHVAVGAADVDVRAGVVGDERGVVAAPGAGEIPGNASGFARTDQQRRCRDRERYPHSAPLWIHGALKAVAIGLSPPGNWRSIVPCTRRAESTLVTTTVPAVAAVYTSPPVM